MYLFNYFLNLDFKRDLNLLTTETLISSLHPKEKSIFSNRVITSASLTISSIRNTRIKLVYAYVAVRGG
jgi:hypothetical protein